MEDIIDNLLPLYWERPEYTNAWRLLCEQDRDKRFLLPLVLRHLPAAWGSIKYIEDLPGEQFVVLFTHNHDNEGARQNESHVLSVIAETHLITFFGTEGASGPFSIEPYRSFPDRDITASIADYFLRSFMISPLENVALTCSDPIFLWGIEDTDLYVEAIDKYRTLQSDPVQLMQSIDRFQKQSRDYWSVIERRIPMLFDNLMQKMCEMGVVIAGVTVSNHTFTAGHTWLQDQGVAHAGLRATSYGKTQRGRLDKALRGEPYDEQEAALWRLFGGSNTKHES